MFYRCGPSRYGSLYPSDTTGIAWLSAFFTPLISRSDSERGVDTPLPVQKHRFSDD
jgi:hypothetical protein